jgi:purine-binding chemotaxis protein CheW
MSAIEAHLGAERGRELISFRVGAQEFCVDVMAVREIRGWSPTTPLPRAPPYVRGVINLRGAVLPILDMAARLGFPLAEPTSRHVIVVVAIGSRLVGLLVDSVSDILVATDSDLQATPDVRCDQIQAFVSGIVVLEDRMIGVVALDELLPPPEAHAA